MKPKFGIVMDDGSYYRGSFPTRQDPFVYSEFANALDRAKLLQMNLRKKMEVVQMWQTFIGWRRAP